MNWLTKDLKTLKIGELQRLEILYKNAKKHNEASEVKQQINKLINSNCEEFILDAVKGRLIDYYQQIAGYHYTIAEDFKHNPRMRIDRLKKCVIACNALKSICKDAEVYTNRYICQINRNYYL